MGKALNKMTKKELELEYNATRQQIDELGYGTSDLIYLDQIENEIARREYSIRVTYRLNR